MDACLSPVPEESPARHPGLRGRQTSDTDDKRRRSLSRAGEGRGEGRPAPDEAAVDAFDAEAGSSST
jgi:hypothetical protein